MKLNVAVFSKRNWQTFKSAKHSDGKKINRQNKQKDKHDVARQRIWFFESPFHAGTTRFFFGQKKRKLHKKGKLGNKTRKWKPNAEQEPCNFNQSEPLMLIV